MGFSTSATAAVILVAVVMAFSSVTDSMYSAEDAIREAKASCEKMAMERDGTALSFGPIDPTSGNISLTNTGTVVLDPRDIMVLINGTMVDPASLSYEVEDIHGTIFLNPGETMTFHLDELLEGSVICVMTKNGLKFFAEC